MDAVDEFGETATPGRVARMLSVLLLVAMVLLGVLFSVALLIALIMLFPSGMRESFVADLGAAASGRTVMVMAISAAVIMAAWFVVVKMLRQVVATVVAGDPFVPENISRLRWIWVVIAAGEIFRMAVVFFSGIEVRASVVEAAETGLDFRVGTWFFIFVIAALSEAFRVGAEMRRDQELTI